MARCENCGKGPMFGQKRSFSMHASKYKYKANLQKITVIEQGQPVRKVLCAKCIKTLAK